MAAWRSFVLERGVVQPFKQAFREVYLLAPAERETATYSNRFAAHIVRYPQTYALMKARRWSVAALGPFDNDGGRNRRDFPAQRIRAELWLEQVETADDDEGPLSALAATDQVRFYELGNEEPLRLDDVPPVVFSEAMRDVDLFVSVTSVAADQNWEDRGPNAQPPFVDQFAVSFDEELTSSARVRRDVLERLLPGLTIADRCEVLDRWLRVRGDVRTYRIHLGSGNILMEPTDTYLCIVPERGRRRESVFLPFDDDPRLSLILSKAFLLANDKAIRDPTIIRQIEARQEPR